MSISRLSLQVPGTATLPQETHKERLSTSLGQNAPRLQRWQFGMLSQGGRLILVKIVLMDLPIFSFMVLDPPPSVIREIDKGRCAFLLKGTESVAGGHCLFTWQSVCKPTCYGGLGLHNLRVLGRAMHIRWLWLQRLWIGRPWRALSARARNAELELFQVSLEVRLGNGKRTLFWLDRWINGQGIQAVAPSLIASVPLAIRNKRTVAEALPNDQWVHDITSDINV